MYINTDKIYLENIENLVVYSRKPGGSLAEGTVDIPLDVRDLQE